MKKVLVSLMVITLALGLAAAGSFAYFDDTETSTGNNFTAGTIDISINPTSGQVVTAPVDETDLVPGVTGFITINVKNDGNNPADLWKMISNVVTEENGITEPEQVYYGTGPAKNDIDTVTIYGMKANIGGAGDKTIVDPATALDVSDVANYWIYIGVVQPGDTAVITQSYMMRTDTGNWAQSDKMTFQIDFFAQQSQGDTQPPAVTPELSGYGR